MSIYEKIISVAEQLTWKIQESEHSNQITFSMLLKDTTINLVVNYVSLVPAAPDIDMKAVYYSCVMSINDELQCDLGFVSLQVVCEYLKFIKRTTEEYKTFDSKGFQSNFTQFRDKELYKLTVTET